MLIKIPYPSIVITVGISASGKSSFVKKNFERSEILESDFFRYMIADDENDQSVSEDAFESLYFIAERRIENNKLVVIDATSVTEYSRRRIHEIARTYKYPIIAIVFDIPIEVCKDRNDMRERTVPIEVLEKQRRNFDKTLFKLSDEPFDQIHILRDTVDLDTAVVETYEENS